MSKKTFVLLTLALVIVNATGLFNDIFTGDSAQYATISKLFSESGNYIDIYIKSKDWLDKPHFPFWVCAISMDIFGVNAFAYKLPSFLFFLIGLFYTYKLAIRLYDKETAYLATLILGSSMHIVVSNNDTRAEAMLLGVIMGAVYYLYKLILKFSVRDIVLASLFSAAAVMTKGIFVLVIMYSAIFGHMLVKREFSRLFHYKWILVLILTLVFIMPELYALYSQFDMHPELTVYGETQVSGIRFFFWDSQFGRFFNTGPITGKGDPFFFVHTVLWACAPWAILGIAALTLSIKSLFRKPQASEYLNLFGFMTMFIVFSISKFQLPHYVNIIFPFLAILTASLLVKKSEEKVISIIKISSINLYTLASAAVIGSLAYLYRPEDSTLTTATILTSMFLLFLYFNFFRTKIQHKYVVYGLLNTMLFFIYLNLIFYPSLLEFQSGSKAALYANKEYPTYDLVQTQNDYPFEFYAQNTIIHAFTIDKLKIEGAKMNRLIYTDIGYLDSLKSEDVDYTVIHTIDHYHTPELTMEFINHKTRESALQKRYLIRMTENQ